VHAQGVVAESVVAQVDPEQLNVLKPREAAPPEGGFKVPEGPAGGPLQGSSMSGAIPAGVQPEPLPPDPEGMPPALNSINPSSARIGTADVTMNVNGQRFVEGAVIVFNGGDEPTTFHGDLQLSTIVKPSLAEVAISVPVWVRNPDGQRSEVEKTFTFTDPQVEEQRTFPAGPFTITLVEDHPDGIAVTLADGDVRVGDAVLVEATGNTSINGAYTVLSVDGQTVVVDNDVTLETPIEAKGRLTVNGEA